MLISFDGGNTVFGEGVRSPIQQEIDALHSRIRELEEEVRLWKYGVDRTSGDTDIEAGKRVYANLQNSTHTANRLGYITLTKQQRNDLIVYVRSLLEVSA